MRNEAMHVMYVGKASNLRNRIRSYFANSANLSPKIRRMVDQIADFEYIVAESEQEALILECNLIKEHKPQYNARLKDDKSYPFIKIDVSEEFPQVYITRKVTNDGARYFGPFANAGSVRRTEHVVCHLDVLLFLIVVVNGRSSVWVVPKMYNRIDTCKVMTVR